MGASAVQYDAGHRHRAPFPVAAMGLLTGMGVVWIVSPTIEVLPFEFPGIRPREVAVIASLVKTLSGLGFAMGPVVTGVVTQYTGSLQTGCLTLCGLTSVGIIAGLLYPSSHPSAEAVEVLRLTVSVARWPTIPMMPGRRRGGRHMPRLLCAKTQWTRATLLGALG